MKNCSVKNCFEDTENGDSLFCMNCRQIWRVVCDNTFGFENTVPEISITSILTDFQSKAMIR